MHSVSNVKPRLPQGTKSTKDHALSSKELVFIGVGGITGAGFFLGCGLPIRTAGPAVLVCYLVGALITAHVVGALTTVSVNRPVEGAFKAHADMFLGPFIGFVQGWTYYLTSVLTIASEAVAMSIFTQVWFPFLPAWSIALVYTCMILALNAFGLRNFGRIESVMSIVKIAALIGFIVFSVFILVAALFFGTHISSQSVHALTSMHRFFPNGFSGMLQSMLIVIFAYAGIGVFATAAGQVKNPDSVDKSAKWTVSLLAGLYFLSILFVMCLTPWDTVSTSSSPFVEALTNSGFRFVALVLNAVILVAAFSVMAGAVFSANLILVSLAQTSDAPKFVLKRSKNGSFTGALLVTAIAVLGTLILSYTLPSNVYNFLISASSFFTLLNWVVILITFIVFLRQSSTGPFVSRLSVGYPYTTYATILLLVILTVYALFLHDERIGFVAFAVITILIALCYKLLPRHGRRKSS